MNGVKALGRQASFSQDMDKTPFRHIIVHKLPHTYNKEKQFGGKRRISFQQPDVTWLARANGCSGDNALALLVFLGKQYRAIWAHA